MYFLVSATGKLEEITKSGPTIMHKGNCAYLRCSERPTTKYFMVSQDENEVTVVVKQANVDEVRIYNRSLSSEQVLALFNKEQMKS